MFLLLQLTRVKLVTILSKTIAASIYGRATLPLKLIDIQIMSGIAVVTIIMTKAVN